MLGDMFLWLVANLKQGVIYFIKQEGGNHKITWVYSLPQPMFIIPFYRGTHFFKFLTQAACTAGLKQGRIQKFTQYRTWNQKRNFRSTFSSVHADDLGLHMNYCNDVAIISPSLLKYRWNRRANTFILRTNTAVSAIKNNFTLELCIIFFLPLDSKPWMYISLWLD